MPRRSPQLTRVPTAPRLIRALPGSNALPLAHARSSTRSSDYTRSPARQDLLYRQDYMRAVPAVNKKDEGLIPALFTFASAGDRRARPISRT